MPARVTGLDGSYTEATEREKGSGGKNRQRGTRQPQKQQEGGGFKVTLATGADASPGTGRSPKAKGEGETPTPRERQRRSDVGSGGDSGGGSGSGGSGRHKQRHGQRNGAKQKQQQKQQQKEQQKPAAAGSFTVTLAGDEAGRLTKAREQQRQQTNARAGGSSRAGNDGAGGGPSPTTNGGKKASGGKTRRGGESARKRRDGATGDAALRTISLAAIDEDDASTRGKGGGGEFVVTLSPPDLLRRTSAGSGNAATPLATAAETTGSDKRGGREGSRGGSRKKRTPKAKQVLEFSSPGVSADGDHAATAATTPAAPANDPAADGTGVLVVGRKRGSRGGKASGGAAIVPADDGGFAAHVRGLPPKTSDAVLLGLFREEYGAVDAVILGDAEGRVTFPTHGLRQRALAEMAAKEVAPGYHITLHDPNKGTDVAAMVKALKEAPPPAASAATTDLVGGALSPIQDVHAAFLSKLDLVTAEPGPETNSFLGSSSDPQPGGAGGIEGDGVAEERDGMNVVGAAVPLLPEQVADEEQQIARAAQAKLKQLQAEQALLEEAIRELTPATDTARSTEMADKRRQLAMLTADESEGLFLHSPNSSPCSPGRAAAKSQDEGQDDDERAVDSEVQEEEAIEQVGLVAGPASDSEDEDDASAGNCDTTVFPPSADAESDAADSTAAGAEVLPEDAAAAAKAAAAAQFLARREQKAAARAKAAAAAASPETSGSIRGFGVKAEPASGVEEAVAAAEEGEEEEEEHTAEVEPTRSPTAAADTPPFSKPISPEPALVDTSPPSSAGHVSNPPRQQPTAAAAVTVGSAPRTAPLTGAALAQALSVLNDLPPAERAVAAQRLLGKKRVQKPRRKLAPAAAVKHDEVAAPEAAGRPASPGAVSPKAQQVGIREWEVEV